MAIVMIEYRWTPEDDNYIRFIGVRDSLEEALDVVSGLYDETWLNDFAQGLMSFDYEIRIGDHCSSSYWWLNDDPKRPIWMGEAVGCAVYDNGNDKYMWLMFDENVPTTVRP